MRDAFTRALMREAAKDDRLMLVTGDLGFGVLKPFWETYPEQFVNAGIAEQSMTGLAAGLATGVAVPGALPESCAAGGWRARLLDKRDAVLARADLPAGHRVLHPGDLMTAEVNPQRMTVTVNSKGKIDNVYCG